MQRKPKRYRRVYVVIAFLCFLLLIGGSYIVYAAMTATDREENDFQIGQVETRIDEVFNEELTEIPKDTPIQKEVRIKNTGTIKQFVRVMVLPEVRISIVGDDQNEQVLPLEIGTDLELEGMVTADWLNGGDGYYYYIKEAVDPDQFTSYLFETVKLSDQLSDRYDKAKLSITLKAETINCAKFAYRDAWWQGTIPTESPLKDVEDALNTEVEE